MRWTTIALLMLAACTDGSGTDTSEPITSIEASCPPGERYDLADGGILCGDAPHPDGYTEAAAHTLFLSGCARYLEWQLQPHLEATLWQLEYEERSPGGRVTGTLIESEDDAEFLARWYLDQSGAFERLTIEGPTFDAFMALGLASCPDGAPSIVLIRAHD